MRRPDPEATLIVAALLIVFAMILAAGVTLELGTGKAASRQVAPSKSVCFPRHHWDAEPRQRPCLTIYDLAEDGSANLYLERASHAGRRWSCKVPATDRRTPRRFAIRCKRIPRAGILPPWVER